MKLKQLNHLFAIVAGIILLLCITSCGANEKPASATITKTADTVETVVDNVNFTRYYEGDINNKYGIYMTLTKNSNSLSGTYSYKSKGIPIKISGSIDNEGNLTIFEFNDKGSMTGIFTGQLSRAGIIGNWSKPDGSVNMPFSVIKSARIEDTADYEKVYCEEKEVDSDTCDDPILIKTCFFRNYKTITKGYPDYRGRYYYEYTLLKKNTNGIYSQVKNASIFNQDRNELLSIINAKIKENFYAYLNDLDTRDCFSGIAFQPFSFDQLRIEFNENSMDFHAGFGLSSACLSVAETFVSMKFEEINKYFAR